MCLRGIGAEGGSQKAVQRRSLAAVRQVLAATGLPLRGGGARKVVAGLTVTSTERGGGCPATHRAPGMGREGASEAAPEAVRQAVGGGCPSG